MKFSVGDLVLWVDTFSCGTPGRDSGFGMIVEKSTVYGFDTYAVLKDSSEKVAWYDDTLLMAYDEYEKNKNKPNDKNKNSQDDERNSVKTTSSGKARSTSG